MRFVGDLRSSDREWAHGLGIDEAWEETGFLPYREALTAQRSADALLLLIPNADGRGDVVVSGKVFEYLAAGRPILAAVPPAGVAADLIRRTESGAGRRRRRSVRPRARPRRADRPLGRRRACPT